MADAFDDVSGVIYDLDGGYFDGPEVQNIDLGLGGDGIGSVEGFGLGELTLYVEAPPAITTAEAFGSPELTLHIDGSGLVSEEAFGAPEATLHIDGTGIASEEAFGSHEAIFVLWEYYGKIASAEAFGTLTTQLHVYMSGIASGEAHPLQEVYPQWQPDEEEQEAAWNVVGESTDPWNKASSKETTWNSEE